MGKTFSVLIIEIRMSIAFGCYSVCDTCMLQMLIASGKVKIETFPQNYYEKSSTVMNDNNKPPA